MRINNKAAFTIVEIFVVIIIMGVLAAVAIPSYLTGFKRSNARGALDNLLAIQTSQVVYAEAQGSYYVSNDTLVDDSANMNPALHTNISPVGGIMFFCDSSSVCHAKLPGAGGFDIGLDLKVPMNKVGVELVYCTGLAPDSSSNPCCIYDDVAQAGKVCP